LAWVIVLIPSDAGWNITLHLCVSALSCQQLGENLEIMILARESGPYIVTQQGGVIANGTDLRTVGCPTIHFITKSIRRHRTHIETGLSDLQTPESIHIAALSSYRQQRSHQRYQALGEEVSVNFGEGIKRQYRHGTSTWTSMADKLL
jgi:hypothetical protein